MLKQDKIVLNQAILRHKEREARQKREIPVPKGPGWTSTGSIHDCNRKHFERVLRAYWDKLYVGWNPMKNDGKGCWEIWQRPSHKTPKLAYHNEDTGEKIYTLEYQPNDFEHWVADLDYLDYAFISKLRDMDGWENKQLVSDHDYNLEKHNRNLEEVEEKHLKYVVRHNKQVFRDLLDYTQAGYDPLQFFSKKV